MVLVEVAEVLRGWHKSTFRVRLEFRGDWRKQSKREDIELNWHWWKYRFVIRSERTELRRPTRFEVRKCFWYVGSSSHHGAVIEKNAFSFSRASCQVQFCFKSFELGCLTQYQLLSRGSLEFLMNFSHSSSSPCGIRSGLVKTPNKHDWR